MAAATQTFQFVPCSGSPNKDKRQSLTSIRKHVMHDYFRKQAVVASGQGSRGARHSDTTAGDQIIVRPKTKARTITGPEQTSSNAVVTSFTFIVEDPEAETKKASVPQHSTKSCPKQARKQRQVAIIGSPPGAHRSDPFDCFPVKNIPDDLIEWFPTLYQPEDENSDWVHKTNVEWARNIWQSSKEDSGLFYTVLSQAERNRMVLTESVDDRRYLFLRGQALHALRKRISAAKDEPINNLVLLVAYQVRFAIVEGDFEIGRMHLQAAQLLIENDAAKIGPFVIVHATLMDVKLAAASWTRPVLEFTDHPLRLDTTTRLAEIIRNRTRISMDHFPEDFRGADADEAMTGMHWHFLKYDSKYGKEIPGTFSVLLNCIHTARHLRKLAADAWDGEIERGYTGHVRPRTAIIFCLEFFAWMHDPAHVIPWISHSEFMTRLSKRLRPKLMRCVDPGCPGLETEWVRSGASLRSLLWVLMLCFVMTTDGQPEARNEDFTSAVVLRAMKRVMAKLQIFNQYQLEQALKAFPWTDNFCGTWSATILGRLEL